MRFLLQKAKSNRTLLTQLIFTALAFTVMAVLSSLFMNSTVHSSLIRHANGVLNLTQDRLLSNLSEFEATHNAFATEARVIALRGETDTRAYLEEISGYAFLDGKETAGVQDFFGYFEFVPGKPVLLHSSRMDLPGNYEPEEQEWFKLAIAANGERVETVPEIRGGETLYTYAKCVFDDDGRRIGVVCMNVKIDLIGQSIVETSLNQGGYGILINQNDIILFHPNLDFRGMDANDQSIPLSVFADDFDNNIEIFEEPLTTYKEEEAVAFFRKLPNGWRLGLVTPEEQYFHGIENMGLIFGLLAAVLAAILIGILIRLDAARSKSDEENRQKSVFLANMSHEIRTPINAIVGMTAIGRAAGAAQRKDYCFSKIDDASRHLLGVINDILDISKIEANKIELSPSDFNFERMLQQAVNVITFRVDEKHQKFSIYIDKTIPKVLYADDQRLAQIITNLLSNAVKFTPDEGSISLKTRLLSEENDSFFIQFEVSDNGIGISREQQSKLFQSFQQAESSTTRKYGGTGLGLSISKNIVELMGGNIWVESEIGKGATFFVNVRVKRGDDTKYGLAGQGVNWENIRILTVDDDQDILDYFQEIVNGFGANCEVAQDAGQALSLVSEKGSYNVYFIDLKMPDVDGISLTKEIRAREKIPGNSIVIMISSADLSSVEDEARKAGVDKFLLKPIFPSSIADAISECIGIVNEKAGEIPDDINKIFAGRHILFAEDVEINREIVLTLLEPTLVDIDCAENGMEAVNMFIKNPEKYDLIFMDVQMPEMDGFEATRQIRSLDNQKAKDIPIIAMTANVFREDVEKCIAEGMNAHLGKPLDIDEMIRMMLKYLGGRSC